MSKILIFSDLHIHPHKRSSERLQDCLDCLEWVFQIAIDRSIESVVFLGDLFHDRQKIDVLTYQRTFEIFEKFLIGQAMRDWVDHPRGTDEIIRSPFNVYLLLGNHDLWHLNKWDVSSVNPLRAIPGVEVIDEPTTLFVRGSDHPISFMPYTADPLQTLLKIENGRSEHFGKGAIHERYLSLPKILCGHVAVNGALWNTKHQTFSEVVVEHDGDMVPVDVEVFKGWNRVFLGHYHAAQQLDAVVEYVGSPLQLSFGETLQTKHILIYDLETDKKEYVENDFSPKHLVLTESQLKKHDIKGQFVRLSIDDLSAANVVEIQKSLLEKGVKELHLSQAPKNEEHVVEDAKSLLLNQDELLKRYVESLDLQGLDKDKLLKIGMSICQEDGE